MAVQAGGGFKTLLSMGFAKPCSPGTAARRFKADLEETGMHMCAAEAAKAASKALQEKSRRRPGCPRKSLIVSNVLGIGAGSGTVNAVAAKGGNIVILDPESASGERGDPIELDGENQDGQPRVEDPALEGGGKDGSAGRGDKDGLRQSGAKSDEPPQKKVRRQPYVNWFTKDLWLAIEKTLKETNFHMGETVKLLKMRHPNPNPGQQYSGGVYEKLSKHTVDSWLTTTALGRKMLKEDAIKTVREMREFQGDSAEFKGRMSLNRGAEWVLKGTKSWKKASSIW
ncbi:unnamed protein product [Sphagnum balticum]